MQDLHCSIYIVGFLNHKCGSLKIASRTRAHNHTSVWSDLNQVIRSSLVRGSFKTQNFWGKTFVPKGTFQIEISGFFFIFSDNKSCVLRRWLAQANSLSCGHPIKFFIFRPLIRFENHNRAIQKFEECRFEWKHLLKFQNGYRLVEETTLSIRERERISNQIFLTCWTEFFSAEQFTKECSF